MESKPYLENIMKKRLYRRKMSFGRKVTGHSEHPIMAHHKRITDSIAISPDGKIVLIEMESIKPCKSSQESIMRR